MCMAYATLIEQSTYIYSFSSLSLQRFRFPSVATHFSPALSTPGYTPSNFSVRSHSPHDLPGTVLRLCPRVLCASSRRRYRGLKILIQEERLNPPLGQPGFDQSGLEPPTSVRLIVEF